MDIPYKKWKKSFYLFMTISLLLILTTSYFSLGFIHPDEHFQIIEFAGSKLGITDVSKLTWEYSSKIRPWMQPGFYYLVIKLLNTFSIHNPFFISFILRAISGVIGWASMMLLGMTAYKWFTQDDEKRFLIISMSLLWYIPFLLVRTSSENFSASFFTIGFCLLMQNLNPEESQDEDSVPYLNAIAGGIFLGLSFEFRFQIAFLIFGLLTWLIFISKINFKKFVLICFGGLIPVIAGIFVDMWGYGLLTFTPYNYFKSNILDGTAAKFGTMPFYSYPSLLLNSVMAPLFLIMIIAALLTWYRHSKHVITWSTLSFVFFHSMVGHKEARFLYPLGIIGVLFLMLAFSPYSGKPLNFISYLWEKRKGSLFKILFGLNLIGLTFLIFYPVKLEMLAQKYFYYNYNENSKYYTMNYENLEQMVFYLPEKCVIKKITNILEFEKIARKAEKEIYFIFQGPILPFKSEFFEKRGILCYSTLPIWLRDYLFYRSPFRKQISNIKGVSFSRSWVWFYKFSPITKQENKSLKKFNL